MMAFDIRGAKVSTQGEVLEQFGVVVTPADEQRPVLARGPGSQLFLAYQGWTAEVNGRWCDANRAYGFLGPFGGVEERPGSGPAARSILKVLPSLVRHAGIVECMVAPGPYALVVYDVSGRAVRTLAQGRGPGRVAVGWDGTGDDGRRLAAGAYVVRLEAQPVTAAVRLVLLR